MNRVDPAADLITPNAENRYEVSHSDLPLSCPMPGMHLWNSHPRVYLPIEAHGEASCPYCGAHYVLEGGHSHAA
ncbi:MAG: zinc-finger domain-containing protein [Xanthomonadales bacterium]|nr:zinc-finger domain-containing protein [Xanthomonadales bacterium]